MTIFYAFANGLQILASKWSFLFKEQTDGQLDIKDLRKRTFLTKDTEKQCLFLQIPLKTLHKQCTKQ